MFIDQVRKGDDALRPQYWTMSKQKAEVLIKEGSEAECDCLEVKIVANPEGLPADATPEQPTVEECNAGVGTNQGTLEVDDVADEWEVGTGLFWTLLVHAGYKLW